MLYGNDILKYLPPQGFHLTVCTHLLGRNEEGWKLSDTVFIAYVYDLKNRGIIAKEEASILLKPLPYAHIKIPDKVISVDSFGKDVDVLCEMLD